MHVAPGCVNKLQALSRLSQLGLLQVAKLTGCPNLGNFLVDSLS